MVEEIRRDFCDVAPTRYVTDHVLRQMQSNAIARSSYFVDIQYILTWFIIISSIVFGNQTQWIIRSIVLYLLHVSSLQILLLRLVEYGIRPNLYVAFQSRRIPGGECDFKPQQCDLLCVDIVLICDFKRVWWDWNVAFRGTLFNNGGYIMTWASQTHYTAGILLRAWRSFLRKERFGWYHFSNGLIDTGFASLLISIGGKRAERSSSYINPIVFTLCRWNLYRV